MSNRYEREIEEILRKSEDARPGLGDRIRAFNQRSNHGQGGVPRMQVNSETLLITGVVLAFVAATIKWIVQTSTGIFGVTAGVLGIAAFVMIVGACAQFWLQRNRPKPQYYKGQIINFPNGRRRNPFSSLMVIVQLWRLRSSYRQRFR